MDFSGDEQGREQRSLQGALEDTSEEEWGRGGGRLVLGDSAA